MEKVISRNVKLYLKICFILTTFTGAYGNLCRLWNHARYFNGYCYYVSNTTLIYQQAKISCEQMDKSGAVKLAEPKTDLQYLFLKDMVRSFNLSSKSATGVMLGGVRDGQSTSFIWSSGDAVTKWWYPERPDDHLNKEDCLEMRIDYDFELNDVDCGRPVYYACEKYIGDPCESVLEGSEYFDGACYTLYNQTLVWNDSIKTCEQHSGHLAEPWSISAVQFLLLLIKTTPGQNGQDSYYLGASDEQSEGTFRWLTNGDPVTVDYWGSGEPSNRKTENYLAIRALTMKLNDVPRNSKSKFFCQKTTGIFKHTYLVVLPRQMLLSGAQLLIASSEHQSTGIYSVQSQRADNCDVDKTYQNDFPEVVLAFEPQKSIDLDPCLGMTSSGIFKQYVKIRSSHELTVILSATHTSLSTFDITASLILRTALLSQNYYLLSVPYGSGQLTVTALTDSGADVILKVPPSYRQDVVLGIAGVSLKSPGYATVTLDMYQTVVIDIRHLRAGFIYATKPIAVSYLAEMATQGEASFSHYTLEMLIPVELLTSEYITFPSWPLSEQLEIYHLLAVYDNTNIVIHSPQLQTVALSLSGDVQEITLPGSAFYYLKSDVPFQARKTSTSETTGTCFTTLQPSSTWHTDYVYFTPSINISTSTETNITISSVLFLISEYPQFDISYPVVGSCLEIEGTHLSGCYFPIPWGMLEPVYITNNGATFAAYAAWIKNNSTLLTCYPLSVDTSSTYWQNFDGPGNINFNDTACNLANELTINSSVPSTSVYNTTEITWEVTTEAITAALETTSTDQAEITWEVTTEAITAALETTSTDQAEITSTKQDVTSTDRNKPVLTTPNTGFYDSLKQIQHELEMNHKDTSAYRRTKMSIADMRVSSMTIGFIGIMLLAMFAALIVLPDILSLIKYLIVRGMFQNQPPVD